jgi:hypothetical protein
LHFTELLGLIVFSPRNLIAWKNNIWIKKNVNFFLTMSNNKYILHEHMTDNLWGISGQNKEILK